jgi:glycosyltransferase involved in cell wall biosynthesis
LKVLLISQYFYPENFKINDLIFSLKERGHKITVLTGKPNYSNTNFFDGYGWKSPDFEIINDIPVYRANLFSRRNGAGFRLFLNYFSFAFLASFKLRKIKGIFDAIFVYEPSPITVGIPAIFAKKRFKAPIYFWVQDLWPESLIAAGGVKNRLVIGLFNSLTKYIYGHSKKILVQSNGFTQYILNQGVPKEKIIFFPNPTEDFYKPLSHVSEYKEHFSENHFNIVFAGNIGEAQSFETLIKAAAVLKDFSIQWIILGDGRYKETALSLIRELQIEAQFKLLGSFPAREMPKFFSHADALLVSLKKDKIFSLTIPAKIQSYLACGKPIIASLDGVGAEIVDEAQCGVTASAEQVDALVLSIKKLISIDLEERIAMGLNARAYYEKEFDKQYLLDILECILED